MKQSFSVLLISDYYLPGFKGGGPIKSLSNMVEALGDRIEFKIVTQDRDLHDTASYPNIETGKWIDVGRGKVIYIPPKKWTALGIRAILRSVRYDVLYINSVFSPITGIYPLLLSRIRMIRRTPVVLAPRGEFSPGALANKSFKKKVYLSFAKLAGLHKQLLWHATSDLERLDVIKTTGALPEDILTAPNLVSVNNLAPDVWAANGNDQGPLRLVFLSRIVPKKNLAFLLTALKALEKPVHLTIYGPAEDEVYWRSCLSLLSELPKNISVDYRGDLNPREIGQVLPQFDLFAFPTLGENFGHVIFESLSAGLPILISDNTPWKSDGTAAVNVQPLQIDNWVEELRKWVSKPAEERIRAKQAAVEYARSYCTDNPSISQTYDLFAAAIKRSRP
jgi:glycosyltransferase involved in cell wall biosynthesis